MNYDGANSHFMRQPGLGPGSAHGTANDHKSIYLADSHDVRSPLGIGEVGAVTDAQAYARAIKTGETQDRALYYTIERKQPERKGKANTHFTPLHPGDPGDPERGLSFAQRLYASALSQKSSNLPSSNIPVLPPITHASSSALPLGDGSQASSGVPPRTTSTSMSDTSSEVSQSFNPADLYHSSVATHGFAPRESTGPEASAKRRRSLLPVFQIPDSLSVTPSSHPVHPHASSQNPIPQLQVRNPHRVSQQFQTVPMEAQPYRRPAVHIHEASHLQGASVEIRPPVVASSAIPPLLPLEQQPVIAPSSSPPAFEEHEGLYNPFEEVVTDVASVDIQSLAAVPREDGLPDSPLHPPPEVNHDEAPLYSLVDEQPPPPAFDDLQLTNVIEVSAEQSLVVRPETLHREETPSPSQSPPPFSHGSAAHDPGKAPAYALLDKTLYPVGTSKNMLLQGAGASPPFIITESSSGASLSDSPSVVSTDFQSPNPPPLVSPPTSPLLSNFHSLSVLSSHPPDRRSTRTLYDSFSVRKSTATFPPPVNYHIKPTAEQSGQQFFPPPALQSGFRTPEDSNTARQGRFKPQPVVNVAGENFAVDTLTRSMSNMMGGPLLDTHTLAVETLPSGRQNTRGTSLGNQQNNLVVPSSHPSGTHGIIGPLNWGTSRPGAECLIQEVYRPPTHGEAGGKAGYRIQGSGSGSLHGSWQGYAD